MMAIHLQNKNGESRQPGLFLYTGIFNVQGRMATTGKLGNVGIPAKKIAADTVVYSIYSNYKNKTKIYFSASRYWKLSLRMDCFFSLKIIILSSGRRRV